MALRNRKQTRGFVERTRNVSGFRHFEPMKTHLIPIALLVSGAPLLAAENPSDAIPAEQRDFFEKKIRPVLAEKCYGCHSEKAEKIKGGLTLDTREGIRRGGDNGPAVVPGSLKDSLLIEAIQYTNQDFAMPPEKKGGKLPETVIADFEKWVQMGAPDPRGGSAKVAKKADMEEAKKWWAFQPVKKPEAPQIKDAGWPRGEIDKLVLAGIEAKGLKPVSDADKLVLLRRVYFDLIGLPPPPEEIERFLKTPNTGDLSAFNSQLAALVDRLLASPQFGERWGRHWLDVARFAESSGKDANIAFPHAWRYRDYVIAAFNADKPFDQFVREQIAGDLLPSKNQQEHAEHLIATGFLAVGTKGLNEMNQRQFALDLADEQIDAVSQSVLGLTVACARCHDHKFDPIPQRDYYAMAGIFLSTETRYGTAQSVQNRRGSDLIELPTGADLPTLGKTLSSDERARKEERLAALRKEQEEFRRERFSAGRNAAPPNNLRPLVVLTQIGELEQELKSFSGDGQSKALAMGVQDRPAEGQGFFGFRRPFQGQQGPGRFLNRPAFPVITDSPLFARGDVDKPGEKVPRGVLAMLDAGPAPAMPPKSSGRRELADWLVSEKNPLTSRVIANRLWHWLFGRGIVESVDNFGTMGGKPANPALLDYLAARVVENGWSLKMTIREIVLSRTYQLSSTFDEMNFAADPENTLNWRMSPRRLDAECIRDAMLSMSGALELKPPVGSLVARAGDGPIGGPRFRGISQEQIVNAGGNFRSVYLPVPRDVLPDALAAFDFAENSLVTGARETTNVPSQALYLLNSDFVTAQAQKLADRVLAAFPGGPNAGVAANLDQRVAHAYWLTLARPPDAAERQAAMTFFAKFPSNWSKGDKSAPGIKDAGDVKAAWTSYCRALFGTAEFRYLN
jgi:hypothetical protein